MQKTKSIVNGLNCNNFLDFFSFAWVSGGFFPNISDIVPDAGMVHFVLKHVPLLPV